MTAQERSLEYALSVGRRLLSPPREYAKIIDMLADPSLFAKGKSLIADRAEYDASTCGMDHAQVFSEFLVKEASEASG